MDCIFCAIVAGTAPAEVIYEDAHALAFLDIAGITVGHTLVVPREHCADLTDIGSTRAADLMRSAVEVAAILRDALEPAGMNILHASGEAAWQSVFHFHLHLVPRYDATELTSPFPARQVADPATLAEVAARIRADALG